MTFRTSLYRGHVYHKRNRPVVHELRYSVFSLLVDLDELPVLSRTLWLFSWNRFNLFSFHDADFGDGEACDTYAGGDDVQADDANARLDTMPVPLRRHVHRKLAAARINWQPCRILLSCYPRVLGYGFNPLSIYYCLDENDVVRVLVHEVHNTFGERHAYVLPVSDEDDAEWIQQEVDKALFVSPFAHMNLRYRFRLNVPGERQIVSIRVDDDTGPLILASYSARRLPLTANRLLRLSVQLPFLTLKVIAGIHWEALKLWIKRVPLFAHQPKPGK